MTAQFGSATDFTFAQLSPDVILNALESIGIYPTSGLLALNSYENRVYQFATEDARYVVKFYRSGRWSDTQIQEEHDFSLELERNEVPVIAPLCIAGQTLHHFESCRFTLFPSAGGRQLEVDNLDQLEVVGRFLGRTHQIGQAKPFVHRAEFSAQSHLHDPFAILHESSMIPMHLRTAFFAILEPVVNETAARYITTPHIRLHGDCHPSNILWRDGPRFVDLDDCRQGPAMQDLWLLLNGDRQQQLLQLDTLVGAYEEFADFDHSQLPLIEPLRTMRMVHYMAWLTQRWVDPAFPQAFPWFAEDKYWEYQILALKEQLAALNEPPLKLMP
ncbi:MAG: serine/threonine protein kinase [Alteromonadaceae bacterium]|nr:serine/threonine protein kinase [Alteromonadaceae bacterium]